MCKGNCISINKQQSQEPGYRSAPLLFISSIQNDAAVSTHAQNLCPHAHYQCAANPQVEPMIKDPQAGIPTASQKSSVHQTLAGSGPEFVSVFATSPNQRSKQQLELSAQGPVCQPACLPNMGKLGHVQRTAPAPDAILRPSL